MASTIEAILRDVNRDLSPQFEDRLRAALAERDRDWLADQIVRLALDAETVARFVDEHASLDRAALERSGHVLPGAPPRGTDLIGAGHRSAAGEALLERAKDVLFGLLFGDASTNTHLDRVQRELLTFTLPRFKAGALDFMRASTELAGAGTWQDPESVSNDVRADNVILEVEYGEIASELVGQGIVRCLSLINSLEVNEQILYARMVDVEQSTLIE